LDAKFYYPHDLAGGIQHMHSNNKNIPVILPSLVGAKSNNFVILVGCVQVVSDVASDFSDAFCAWL